MDEDLGGLGALDEAAALAAELKGPVTAEGLVKHGKGALAVNSDGDVYHVKGSPRDAAWYHEDFWLEEGLLTTRIWTPDYAPNGGYPSRVTFLHEALAVLAPWLGTTDLRDTRGAPELRDTLVTRLGLAADAPDQEILDEVQLLKEDGTSALRDHAVAIDTIRALRGELDTLRALAGGRLADLQAAREAQDDAETKLARVDEVLDAIGVPFYPTFNERLAFLAGRGLRTCP